VDPGFVGQIHVPLHNRTCNDYMITGGEPIAWMEFTKLTPNERWTEHDSHGRRSLYVPFPERKRDRQATRKYLGQASAVPITSSIPPLVGSAKQAAVHASHEAEQQRKATEQQLASVRRLSGFALLGVVVTLAAILIAVFNLVEDSNSSRTALTHQVDGLEHEIVALRATRPTK
jgi:hypothetical protein